MERSALEAVGRILDRLGIRWVLAGALAANRYRVTTRMTQDVDLLLANHGPGLAALEHELRSAGFELRRASPKGEILRLRHPDLGAVDLIAAGTEYERQALARMNHPHIAQVFDAGITPEGRPWFAMEFVAGEPLGEFCDRRSLTTEQRVQLLATVARAVQHAHERGFIHRDLKPSNVLVTAHDGQFVPKIIDFGIAKAATPGDEAMRTRADQILGDHQIVAGDEQGVAVPLNRAFVQLVEGWESARGLR